MKKNMLYIKLNSISNIIACKKLILILFTCVYLIPGCDGKIYEKPFSAKIVSVIPKIDGTGYALVLQSVDNPNIWEAAVTLEKLKNGNIVTVDKAKGKILYNGKIEGTIIKK